MKLFWLLSFLICITFSFMHMTYAIEPFSKPIARVVWVKGTFKAMMPDTTERTLQKKSFIYLKDTLITDENTRAEIVFIDNTLMTFYPNTKFYINEYEYQPKGKKPVAKAVMELIEGGFRTITGFIAKTAPADYEVTTPVATIGVRGTDYAVRMENGRLYMSQYAGSPCVSSISKDADTAKTLCLDKKTKYANVAAKGDIPIPLTEQPVALKEKLPIDPATFNPVKRSSKPSNGINLPGICTD